MSSIGVNPAEESWLDSGASEGLWHNVQSALVGVASEQIKGYISELVPALMNTIGALNSGLRVDPGRSETRQRRRPA